MNLKKKFFKPDGEQKSKEAGENAIKAAQEREKQIKAKAVKTFKKK